VSPGHACATDVYFRVFCWSHFKYELVVEREKKIEIEGRVDKLETVDTLKVKKVFNETEG